MRKLKKFICKARKLCLVLICVLLTCGIVAVPVSADDDLVKKNYTFTGMNVLPYLTPLWIDDNQGSGSNQFTMTDYDLYSGTDVAADAPTGAQATWDISSWSSNATVGKGSVWFASDCAKSIWVEPGKKMTFKMTFQWWGLLDLGDDIEFSLRFTFRSIQTSPKVWYGYLPRADIQTVTFEWINNLPGAAIIEDIVVVMHSPNPMTFSRDNYMFFAIDGCTLTVSKPGVYDKTYDDYDDSALTDFKNVENAIGDVTADGKVDTEELFSDLDSTFDGNTNAMRGVFALGKIFNRFYYSNSWLEQLVEISLVLGAFGFIMGVAIFGARSIIGGIMNHGIANMKAEQKRLEKEQKNAAKNTSRGRR